MIKQRKIVWSEGMFIQPQHFQQQERYLEYVINARAMTQQNYGWGFLTYALNNDLLNLGKIGIDQATGIFPDGTLFQFPMSDDVPLILDIDTNIRDQLIYLAIPLVHPSQTEIALQEDNFLTRYRSTESELIDNTSLNFSSTKISLAKLNPRLLAGTADLTQFAILPVARVIECRSDGKVVLDEDFIPPVINCHAIIKLQLFMKELKALLTQRAESLATRMGDVNRAHGVSAITDFLLLQITNQYELLLEHLLQRSSIHPEQLYITALQLVGNLASFGQQQKRPAKFSAYDHNDLAASFKPLMRELRLALNAVIEPMAFMLPLVKQKFGIQVATIHDKALFDYASFIIAVKADIPTESLLQHFNNQTKIGPAEQIRQLINLQLPGVNLNVLPVAPAQIPFNSKYIYFELEPEGDLWQQIKTTGSIAIHTSGDLPNLSLELWAIRGATL